VKIDAIQTGTVAVRSRQREGLGTGTRRRLNTLLDHEWTPPLPIYAFAIEHPEGVIVVDTGENARASEPGYFPRWHPYYRRCVQEWVSESDEIGPQLAALGIAARDVRTVVLTHMHTDHAGGLHHFEGVPILASAVEIAAARGFRGLVRGYPTNRFASWLSPEAVQFADDPYGPFPSSAPLTSAGDVVAVPLPGHTAGQIGVVVEDGPTRVLIAGDASYTQELMLRGAVDGVSESDEVARATLAQLQTLVRERPTVYLPAHDPESAARLAAREPALAVAPAAAQTA
jgi:glyoxylase-like metal-dependent hydrolase (beta-lactamase superfamily II)